MPPAALEALKQGTAGHSLLFPATPAASVLDAPAADPRFAEAEIAFGQPNPKAVLDAKRLKWIHISSSGVTRYDNIEFRALVAERRIMVSNSAMVYASACAAHALCFMLAQARNLPFALDLRTPNGSPAWNGLRGASGTLQGETVLILGYGAIGARLAQLLLPHGAKVVAYRRHARGDEIVPVVTESGLSAALAQAQHIVNVLPDSGQTRHFFNADRFATLQPGAVFYNIGRGATVDQSALLEALRSTRLKAAWLDVTDPEPLPDDHPLWRTSNCFITPHVAGGHADETTALVRHFLANLDRFERNEPLLDRIM
jgi:phosphoglycerate dehydrogenase-like enzyme